MKAVLLIMTGIGFTLGVVFGLLLHLPSDSHPAQQIKNFQNVDGFPNLSNDRLKREAEAYEWKNKDKPSAQIYQQTNDNLVRSFRKLTSQNVGMETTSSGSKSLTQEEDKIESINIGGRGRPRKTGQKFLSLSKQRERVKSANSLSEKTKIEENEDSKNPSLIPGLKSEGDVRRNVLKYDNRNGLVDLPKSSDVIQVKNNDGLSNKLSQNIKNNGDDGGNKATKTSLEDEMYLSSIVQGPYWTPKVEQSCQKPFRSTDTDSWRSNVQNLDVVKMEAGCGRMQNRLLTFRDSSKACARYRLNTDQIQGDIFSYHLAKLLNIPNLPPTILASVNSVDQKWRTVHLDLSLAQWADSKLVVLTKFIDGLLPAHIPKEFQDETKQLHPTLSDLGMKSKPELCELVQWSDLIIFDYITANLDRVINNMFNSQWNDQMMASPTHNLEQFTDGGLVFFDNESGLFHGFRLIDKYEKLHRALLDSICVFRSSTADVIKRLATSGSVGKELKEIFERHEPLAKFVPSMPAKNVKILERRIQQVYQQIVKCEQSFNR